jgi:hypothetical protein
MQASQSPLVRSALPVLGWPRRRRVQRGACDAEGGPWTVPAPCRRVPWQVTPLLSLDQGPTSARSADALMRR